MSLVPSMPSGASAPQGMAPEPLVRPIAGEFGVRWLGDAPEWWGVG